MPELLGGAEASQKGFGERIPAKLMLRSATWHQPFVNRSRGKFAVLDSHYGRGGASRADRISSGINTRETCFKVRGHSDKSLFSLELQLGSE